MNKAEIIAYAIKKECSMTSLVDWCEEWDFTIEEFNRFLESGKKSFEETGSDQDDTD